MKTAEGTPVRGWLVPTPQATEVRAQSLLARTVEGNPRVGSDEVRDILLSAYGSAASQMLALERAVSRVTETEQRRALYRLYALEVQRRELARLSAEALWGFQLAEDEPDAAAA